jgi:hypothetical protein
MRESDEEGAENADRLRIIKSAYESNRYGSQCQRTVVGFFFFLLRDLLRARSFLIPMLCGISLYCVE